MEAHDRRSKISMSKINILIGIGTGIAIAIFFGIRSSILYGSDTNRLEYFTMVFFASLIIYCLFSLPSIYMVDSIAKRINKTVSQQEKD